MRTREGLPHKHRGCPITGKQAGTFIDTGKWLQLNARDREPLLISEAGAHILGRHLGMLEPSEAAKLKADLLTAQHRVSQLEEELAEADAFIDGTEAPVRRGMRVARPPGRPPKKKETE
jgi:hypothetical protein